MMRICFCYIPFECRKINHVFNHDENVMRSAYIISSFYWFVDDHYSCDHDMRRVMILYKLCIKKRNDIGKKYWKISFFLLLEFLLRFSSIWSFFIHIFPELVSPFWYAAWYMVCFVCVWCVCQSSLMVILLIKIINKYKKKKFHEVKKI